MAEPHEPKWEKANDRVSLLARQVRPASLAPGTRASSEPFGAADPETDVPAQRPLSLAMFLRFKGFILLTALAISIPSIVLIWTLVVPQFRVEAQVRVRPIIPRLVFHTDENGPILLYQSYLNTQVAVIFSPTVLQRVLDQPDVQQTQWYKEKSFTLLGRPRSPMDKLRAALEIYPRGMTEVIDIALTDRNAGDAALIINAILDQYLKFLRETSNQTEEQVGQQLTEQYNSLRSDIEGRENQIAKLRKELGSALPEQLLAQRQLRLDEMEGRLEEIHRQLAANNWQIKELEVLLGRTTSRPARTPGNNPRYEEDSEWRRMYIDVRNAQHRIDVEKDRLGDSHPMMIDLRKQLKLAEELLKDRQSQLDDQARLHPGVTASGAEAKSAVTKDIEGLRHQNQLLKYQERLLRDDLKHRQADFDRTFDTAQTLTREMEVVGYRRELYQAVRNQIDRKEVERNRPGSIEVLSRALVPNEPYHDRRLLMSIMAVMAGLGAGVGLAFIRATTSPTVQEPEDVLIAARTPFLGQLPFIPGAENGQIVESPVQAEYIRMVRTALLQRIGDWRGRSIMITSAGPQAGKTTVAMLLARSLTQCGKKVLLVDADLRNPSLAARFGINSDPGLVASLTAQASDADAIVEMAVPGLSVLPASRNWNLADQELLANGTFAGCLERWRRAFDIILFDTPPILPVADARIIARQMDGTIMVIKEGHCRRVEVTEALAYLGAAGGKLVGTVFIGSQRKRGYYSSSYDHYYHSAEGKALTSSPETNQ